MCACVPELIAGPPPALLLRCLSDIDILYIGERGCTRARNHSVPAQQTQNLFTLALLSSPVKLGAKEKKRRTFFVCKRSRSEPCEELSGVVAAQKCARRASSLFMAGKLTSSQIL